MGSGKIRQSRKTIRDERGEWNWAGQRINAMNFSSRFLILSSPFQDAIFFELKVCDQWAAVGDYDTDEAPLVSVYRRHEIPEEFHWRESRLIAPIVLIARPGVVLLTVSWEKG